MPSGLAFSRSSALWAVLGVLPGAIVVAFVDVPGGVGLCLGAIMVGMLGIAPRRAMRPRAALAGIGFALFLVLGAAIARPGWLAVAGIALAPIPASLLASSRPLGRLALALMLPALAIGLSFDSAADATGLALAIGASSIWMAAISLLWPEHPPRARPAPPPMPRPAALEWGIRLGLAAGTATLVGELVDFSHIGWAPAAALLVMRPQRDLLTLRGIGRVCSVLLGAVLAGFVARSDPATGVLALLVALAVVGTVGTAGSRWYVTSAGTTFLSLSMIEYGASGHGLVATTFLARVGATLLGVGVAYVFGARQLDPSTNREAQCSTTQTASSS